MRYAYFTDVVYHFKRVILAGGSARHSGGQHEIARDTQRDGARGHKGGAAGRSAREGYHIGAIAAHTVVHITADYRVITFRDGVIAAVIVEFQGLFRRNAAAIGISHSQRMIAVIQTVEHKAVYVARSSRGNVLGRTGVCFQSAVYAQSRLHVKAAQVNGQFHAYALQDGKHRIQLHFQAEALGVEHKLYCGYGHESGVLLVQLAHRSGHLSARHHIAVFVICHNFHIILTRVGVIEVGEVVAFYHQVCRRVSTSGSGRHCSHGGIGYGFDAAAYGALHPVRQYGVFGCTCYLIPAHIEVVVCAGQEPHTHFGKAVDRSNRRRRVVIQQVGAQLGIFFQRFRQSLIGVSVNFRDVAIVVNTFALSAYHGVRSALCDGAFKLGQCSE